MHTGRNKSQIRNYLSVADDEKGHSKQDEICFIRNSRLPRSGIRL